MAHPPHTHVRKKLEPWRSSTRHDPTAEIKLNGKRVGELTVFLDRCVAFDHVAGKPVEVCGARAQGSGQLDRVRIGV